MAFTPATLSIIAQPFSGSGLRFWSYVNDDTRATITGAGYFTNAARYGLQVGDLIFVTPDSGSVETYMLTLASIGSDGHGTATSDEAPADKTVNIPTDYATLQAAVNALSIRPAAQGVTITLNIEAGHALTAGLSCENGDYGHFRIVSEDATVSLAAGFSGIAPTNTEDSALSDVLLFGFNARMPELACVIDMGNAHDNGYHVTHSSMGIIAPNCGVINAGAKGLFARSSVVYGQSSTWDGANDYGIAAQQGSIVMVQLASCDDCAKTSGNMALLASRGATLNFQSGSAQNSGADGGLIQRSWANLQQANFNGATGKGLLIRRGAHVIGRSMNASNCGDVGIQVQHGSYAALDRATLTNNTGLDLELSAGGGIVNLTAATTTNGSANVPSATDTSLALFNAVQDLGLITVEGHDIGGRFTADPTVDGNTMWHAGNDGASSGLDADLLDGQEGSFYTTAANINHAPGWTGSVSSSIDDDAEAVLRPHKFGAAGDGATDDTAALNLALAFIKSETTSIRARKWFLDGGGKVYRIDGSLDATGITGHHNWGIRNIVLEAHCTGKVALDLTDSRFGLFENVHIHGDATDTPYNGIQQARGTSGNAAGGHFFTNVTVVGDYTNAALHNYASEVCHYDKCKFWNEKAPVGGDEAWAAIFDGAGEKTAISDFATPATGTHAFNLTTLTSCELRKLSVSGSPIFLSRYVGFHARGCYATSDDDAIITMFCDGVSRDFEWHGHAEGTAPTSYIKFTGTAATRNVTGLTLIDHSPHVVDQLFAIDTLTGVNIHELDLRIDNYNAGSLSVGVFDDETKYKVRGSSIVVPSDMNTLSTFAEFTGMVRLTLDGTIKVAGAYQVYSDEAGATVGPTLDIFRDSASPAVSDVLGRIRFEGKNSTGGTVNYSSQGPIAVAVTAGSETGRHQYRSTVSGTEAIRGYYEDGLVWGSPNGLDKGGGTVNVENGYYNNNIPWLTGTGSPEGAVTAPVGSLFSRTDGGSSTTLYVKESGAGNTGWAAK